MSEDNELFFSGQWSRTDKLKERLKDDEKLHFKNGRLFFDKYHVIHRDTAIDGGICLGANQREGVVVDSKNDPILERTGKDFLKILINEDIIEYPYLIITKAYEYTVSLFKIHDMDNIVQAYRNDRTIHLGSFIGYQIGNCVHKSLTCGYLIEMTSRIMNFKDKVSIDRNSLSDIGAHAWARYTFPKTKLAYILDPAKLTHGFLKLIHNNSNCQWIYNRPEDIEIHGGEET